MLSVTSHDSKAVVPSLWRPLRISTFRNLLLADIASDVGTFMQNVGAALAHGVAQRRTFICRSDADGECPAVLHFCPARRIHWRHRRPPEIDSVYRSLDGSCRHYPCRRDHRRPHLSVTVAGPHICPRGGSCGWWAD